MTNFVRLFLNNNLKSSYAKNTFTLLIGSSLAHLVSLFTLPILTRIYTPDQFGSYAVFISWVGIITVFVAGKYELSIVSERKYKRKIALVIISFFLSLSILLFINLIFFILFSFGRFNITDGFLGTFFLISLGVMCTVIHDALINFNISVGSVRPIARSKLYKVISANSFQFIFYSLGLVNYGLHFGDIVGRAASAFTLKNNIFRQRIRCNLYNYIKYLYKVAKKNYLYPLKIAPGWTINNSSTLLLPIFLSSEYGFSISGGFYLMYKVFSLPETAIVQSVNQSFMIEFKSNIGNQSAQLLIFKKTAKRLFLTSFMIYPLLGLLFYFGVGYVFGYEWWSISIYGIIFVPYFVAQFTMSSLYVSLNILNQHSKQFKWDLFRAASLSLLCIIVTIYEIDIKVFMIFLSALTCVFYAYLFYIIKSYLLRNGSYQ